MKRRDFLMGLGIGCLCSGAGISLLLNSRSPNKNPIGSDESAPVRMPSPDSPLREEAKDAMELAVGHQPVDDIGYSLLKSEPQSDIEQATPMSYLDKVRYFEKEFTDDVYVDEKDRKTIKAVLSRLGRVQSYIGHGHYNLISFDQTLRAARNFSAIGQFTPTELDFMEKIFSTEAKRYGFMGQKVSEGLTDVIPKRATYKVPYSGHYLFKGESLAYYDKLTKDVGTSIILTSGIRSNVKQMHLFLLKCIHSNYNLSKASRSLAPPGHSYHGIGDFDVGKIGWGEKNFTDKFATTNEFKRMQDLGYVKIRYTEDNRLGVRFEPWHIKVV